MRSARVFVGYDSQEALAFSVFAHSIHKRSTIPVSVQPVMRSQIKEAFPRPRGEFDSTDFAISRFLVPWLCDFEDWALFADGDMICKADIADLWALRDDKYAVQVVKRPPQTDSGTKFLGRVQTPYERKNWSSVILFNNAQCKALSPPYVNTAPGLDLHQFKWLNDEKIGEIPAEWNHLVGVDKPKEAKLIHYTLGMPFFRGFNECEYAKDWRLELQATMAYEGFGDEGTLRP